MTSRLVEFAEEKAKELHGKCDELLEDMTFGDLSTVPMFKAALLEAMGKALDAAKSKAEFGAVPLSELDALKAELTQTKGQEG